MSSAHTPGPKRLTEDWSGSHFNKDTFISIALSTPFKRAHTHRQAVHVCAGSGFIFSVVSMLSSLTLSPSVSTQSEAAWEAHTIPRRAATPLIRPGTGGGGGGVAMTASLHLLCTS